MKINIPTTCPTCDYPLEILGAYLVCNNLACEAQLAGKLNHFVKVLGIKGLGPKSIEKLNISELTELFYMDKAHVEGALGSKIAEKVILEIEKAKSADLATVLSAFSIPLVGNTASTKLCSVVQSVDEITLETCKAAGLGDKVTSNLLNWLNTEFKEVREFLPFSFKSPTSGSSVQAQANGLTICITGKLQSYKTKAEATKVLTSLGYKVTDSVTKTLSILVDEENRGSDKRKKAESYGSEIVINLHHFISNH
jgi:DNA ligase (NAD+)